MILIMLILPQQRIYDWRLLDWYGKVLAVSMLSMLMEKEKGQEGDLLAEMVP